jgi:hypothetical protein
MLVSVYWNLRALDMYESKMRAPPTEALVAWRRRLVAHRSFPHKKVAWEPTANYGTEELAGDEFVGMHGDELGDSDGDESSADEADEEAPDWGEAAAHMLRPAPARVPADLRQGDKIVVYFAKPYSDWFVGIVDKVVVRAQLPVYATFTDGESRLRLDANLYGVTGGKQWALLVPSEVVDIDDDDDLHSRSPAGIIDDDSDDEQ